MIDWRRCAAALLMLLPAAAAVAAPFVLGDLRQAAAMAAFETFRTASRSYCRAPVTLTRVPADTGGRIVRQTPDNGTPLGCGAAVTVYIEAAPPRAQPGDGAALGTLLTGIAGALAQPRSDPPRSDPPRSRGFAIGRLDDTGRADLERRAARLCRRDWRVGIDQREDASARGSYLEQNLPPDTPFACDQPLRATVSAGLPPWTVPDFRDAGAARRRCAPRRRGAAAARSRRFRRSAMNIRTTSPAAA